MECLVTYLKNLALNNSAKIILHARDGKELELTYHDILKKSLLVAKKLMAQGVQSNEVVSLMLPTSAEFLYTFFGIQLAGAIPTCLYPPIKVGLLDEWREKTLALMANVKSQYLITDGQISKLLVKKFSQSDSLQLSLVEDLIIDEGHCIEEDALPPVSEICFLQFSSGSTGTPKPVTITHLNAISNAKAFLKAMDIPYQNIKCASWLPLYHDMGLVGALVGSMVNQTDLVLMRPDHFILDPMMWFRAMTKHQVTVTVAPNFAYGLAARRANSDNLKGIDLSCLKLSMCGAEPISKQTMDNFIAKFSMVGLNPSVMTPVYGLAEATLAVSFSQRSEPIKWVKFNKKILEKSGVATQTEDENLALSLCSLGTAMQGMEIKILSDSGEMLEEGRVGKICIKGSSVTRGYFNDSQASSSIYIDDLLDTGDKGFFFQNDLYICGRNKDIIIVNGRNISPIPIEETLSEIAELRRGSIVVTSLPKYESDVNSFDSEDQILVVAEVVNQNILSSQSNLENLRASIKKVLAIEGTSNAIIEIVPPYTLPKTSSGKIRRLETKLRWQQKTLLNSNAICSKFRAFLILFKYSLEFWYYQRILKYIG